MKRLLSRLIRTLMFVLALYPPFIVVCGRMFSSLYVGAGIFLIEIAVLSVITLLPAYVGNYREYEVISYEDSRNSDPNPDRETVRTWMSEGRRFPARLTADIAFFVISTAAVLLIPREMFVHSSLIRKIAAAGVLLILQMVATAELTRSAYLWEDIPGVFIGAVGYLLLSIYLHFTAADVAELQTLTSVCAVLYLFMGAVTLNKQSIALSMSAHNGEGMRVPKLIVIRNRRIVLTFATVVTVVSLIEPVRRMIVWLASVLKGLLTKLFGLNPSSSVEPPPMFMGTMMEPVQAAEAAPEMEEMSLLSEIFVYGFLALIAVGFVWLVFDGIKKLVDKLTKWFEQLAGSISEGFYDEKEELMSADEMRDQIKNGLISGVKGLFKREKPWKDLDGREKARRMLSILYKKRAGGISNLRAKTAKEAIFLSDVPEKGREAFHRAYDAARYSEHPVSGEEMDALKKDLRL